MCPSCPSFVFLHHIVFIVNLLKQWEEKYRHDLTLLFSPLHLFFLPLVCYRGRGPSCHLLWSKVSGLIPHILLCVTQTSPEFSLLCIKRFESVWQILHGYMLIGFRRLNCSAVPCHYFLIISLPFPYGSTDVFLTVSVLLSFHTPSPVLSIWRHLCVLTVNLPRDPPTPPWLKQMSACSTH